MEGSIEIRAPPEKVWEMLALDRLPEWMDEMEIESGTYTSKVLTPEDKYRVGATAHMTGEHMIWKAAGLAGISYTPYLRIELKNGEYVSLVCVTRSIRIGGERRDEGMGKYWRVGGRITMPLRVTASWVLSINQLCGVKQQTLIDRMRKWFPSPDS